MHVHGVMNQNKLAGWLDAVGAARKYGRPATEMRERCGRPVVAGLSSAWKVEGSGDAGIASFEAAILLLSGERSPEASPRPVV